MRILLRVAGWVLILVGVVSWFIPIGPFGMHVGFFHNFLNVFLGGLAVYYSRSPDVQAARAFAMGFGAAYLLIGAAGFIFGHPGTPMGRTALLESRLFRPIPGWFEYGTADHILHLAVGAALLLAGIIGRRREPTLPEREREKEIAPR